ncbi:MAG: tetratricopeptide repeat protein [Weeksellaceae bacterium]|nr:tetratricopeptide repeat protein [Weeksellaceae bacterium]
MKLLYKVGFLAVIMMFFSCSVKKNSWKNRNYHAMTTWFNTLFNGQEAMDTRLRELRAAHTDDYFETLNVEPFSEFVINNSAENITYTDPFSQPIGGGMGSSLMGGEQSSGRSGFEKAEEKALKAIATHSMIINREERNKVIARAYLMLGQARYYQGKPFQAMDALQQVVRTLPFDKHVETAKYYMALSNLQSGNPSAAADILEEMYENPDLKKSMKANVAKQFAWVYVKQGELEKAIETLDQAIEYTSNKDDKARFNFIQGQLLTKLEKYDEANAKFEKSFRLKPNFEMEARSKVWQALNFDPSMHNHADYSHNMHRMIRAGAYAAYQNEFYYALGRMAEKIDSNGLAERYYTQALERPVSDPRFRGETFAAFGNLKFENAEYVYATAYYDSAVTVLPESKRRTELTRMRDDLQKVMEKYYLVKRNDSILRLTQMSPAEKETYFNDHIAALKKQDEERRKREEEEATVFQTQSRSPGFSNTFGDERGSNRFYFYSQSAKNSGETEFRRIWGAPQLRDNWRQSVSGSTITDQIAALTGTQDMANPRRYELEFYLERIPTSPAEIRGLKVARDTTEFSLGNDYFDKFENAEIATTTLEHLLETPPHAEDLTLKAYYNLYRINKESNPALAEKYKNIVLNQYPNTLYAEFILNPEADFTEANTSEVIELYNRAFDAYEEEDYLAVSELSNQAFAEHGNAEIIAKFAILNAYAEGAINGREAYIAALERVLILYEGTEEAALAQRILNRLNGVEEEIIPEPEVAQPSSTATPGRQPAQQAPAAPQQRRPGQTQQQPRQQQQRPGQQQNITPQNRMQQPGQGVNPMRRN